MLDKDRVRAGLFGAAVDHSREQDDRAMAVLYADAAARLHDGATGVILDGRTFTRRAAVVELLAAAARAGARLLVVECRCAPEVAEGRLARDAAAGSHPAGNRGPDLHRRLRAEAEPLELPPPARLLVVSTDKGRDEERVAAVLAALGQPAR